MSYPKNLQDLINEFAQFPSIGPKTAERFIFYLLKKSPAQLEKLSTSIKELKKISLCPLCNNFAEKNICPLCGNQNRDHSIICVVADPQDLMALEKTQDFKGVYHILGGLISTTQNTSPENLRVNQLLQRIAKSAVKVKEIILALNPDLEGETTSLYLINLLKPLKIKISRLARGLPIGSDLEYADEITLSNAIKRREVIE
ncbi:MAG: recombination mediator RecR [Patescibacteria group bacterium]|nr:recombination mediator RecR [Patescibacteria group bacterium]MDD5121679.1 recombination mediator RecR [Patescibacteria group bacterium]MDD5222080.1 recombination mediator RecR [Patescibacteria group bacterium]MDD5396157.1 recombination mediator RecR [Patescibacteria group bacterium]